MTIKQMWHYRWAILTALMTAFPMVWTAAPAAWQPHVPGWARWTYMGIGLASAVHAAGTHIADNRRVTTDDTDEAGA